jgi:hypothetical protein
MLSMFEENPFTFSPTFDERYVILGPGIGKMDARAETESEARVIVDLLFTAWKAGKESKAREIREVLGLDEPNNESEPEPFTG